MKTAVKAHEQNTPPMLPLPPSPMIAATLRLFQVDNFMSNMDYVTTVVINRLIRAEELMADNGPYAIAWSGTIMLNMP